MRVESPITHSRHTRLIGEVCVDQIIGAYAGIGLDNHVGRYFSGMDKIEIYECLDTGYRFYFPYTIFGDEAFYAYLQEKMKYYADWRWEHAIAYGHIRPGRAVLEIGCGTGNFLKKIKREMGGECAGLEMNRQALSEARDNGLDVHSQSVEQHARNNQNKYDVVCIFQVLEHVWEVSSFLSGALACLKKGGMLIIGVPNNNPYLFRWDKLHALNLPPHHAGLWDKKSLTHLEKVFGVDLEYIKVEPLFATDHYWNVHLNHWSEHNKLMYTLACAISFRWKRVRDYVLRKSCDGRNILAVYRKQ